MPEQACVDLSCVDLSKADTILSEYPSEEASLIQVLQDVHRAYNYLPCDVLVKVAESLQVPLAKVFSVSTFYKAFSLEPQGDTIIKVCMGTACHIRGAGQLVEEITRQLDIGPDQTTEDMKFTLKTVNCVGACAMAPVMIVGEKYHGTAKAARIGKYLVDVGASYAN
jgi:NADH-quinone oxidoreductase subunit E